MTERRELDSLKPEPGFAYGSSKTYMHNVGLSCCFRQWRAESHCKYLHGYALKVSAEFHSDTLDINNWVFNFGGLKPFKAWLEETFDHKTLVAEDDPALPIFRELASKSVRREIYHSDVKELEPLIQLVVVPSTGVEAFSRMIFDWLSHWLSVNHPSVSVRKVTVSEHEANSAWYGVDPLAPRVITGEQHVTLKVDASEITRAVQDAIGRVANQPAVNRELGRK